MSCDQIVRGLQARKSGSGWMAKCPAHDDSNPSLSIREVDGKVLLHCHAGCSQHDVIAALKDRGYWPNEPHVSASKSSKPELGPIIASYDYTDESGELLYRINRYEPKGAPKEFRAQRPNGRGGWIGNMGGSRRVLYHLPEVLEASIVFIVEGEKDVETLRSHGFVGTTNVFGANSAWLPGYTESLRGREAILIPDNDQTGKQHVLTIARALLGKVARLVILELEDGKDITEWFERGHSEIELIAQLDGEQVSR